MFLKSTEAPKTSRTSMSRAPCSLWSLFFFVFFVFSRFLALWAKNKKNLEKTKKTQKKTSRHYMATPLAPCSQWSFFFVGFLEVFGTLSQCLCNVFNNVFSIITRRLQSAHLDTTSIFHCITLQCLPPLL